MSEDKPKDFWQKGQDAIDEFKTGLTSPGKIPTPEETAAHVDYLRSNAGLPPVNAPPTPLPGSTDVPLPPPPEANASFQPSMTSVQAAPNQSVQPPGDPSLAPAAQVQTPIPAAQVASRGPSGPNANRMELDLANKRADITGGALEGEAGASIGINAAQNDATKQVADATSDANRDNQDELVRQKQDLDVARMENVAWHDNHQKQLESAMNEKVDTNRFWKDKGTANTILAGIGLALGALGGGANRGAGDNSGVDVLQRGIDRDVRAQETDLDHKMKLLNMSGLNQNQKEQLQDRYNAERSNIAAKSYTTALAQVNVVAQRAGIPINDARLQGVVSDLASKRDMAMTVPDEVKVAQKRKAEQAAAAAAAAAFARQEENRKFNRGLSADLIKQDNAAAGKAGAGAVPKAIALAANEVDGPLNKYAKELNMETDPKTGEVTGGDTVRGNPLSFGMSGQEQRSKAQTIAIVGVARRLGMDAAGVEEGLNSHSAGTRAATVQMIRERANEVKKRAASQGTYQEGAAPAGGQTPEGA